MNIVERGQKKPKYPWVGRYQCAYCRSVIELTESDAPSVMAWDEDQREGYFVEVVCPVCEEKRSLSDCNHVIGHCGGRYRQDRYVPQPKAEPSDGNIQGRGEPGTTTEWSFRPSHSNPRAG